MQPVSSLQKITPCRLRVSGLASRTVRGLEICRRGSCTTCASQFSAEDSSACSTSYSSTVSESCRRFAVSAILSMLAASPLIAPLSAQAENVRLEDVDNPALQAGVLAASEGRIPEAERFFKVVLSQDANSASAWSNLANVHLSEGQAMRALEEFTRAISLAPKAPVPYLNRALAEEQLGVEAESAGRSGQAKALYAAAVRDCEEAIQLDPKEFAAWFNKGNIEGRVGRYSAALASYHKAADLAPGMAGYRFREATLLFQTGRVEDAGRLMRSVVRKNPTYGEAHAALAAVQWKLGDRAMAEDHYNAATSMDLGWSKIKFIKATTTWPPKLYDAMSDFLAISMNKS